jgi:hypothetical protein
MPPSAVAELLLAKCMRDDLRNLGAEIRTGIIERLCADLDLDEDDLRALLREQIQSEIEDSIVNDAEDVLKEVREFVEQ